MPREFISLFMHHSLSSPLRPCSYYVDTLAGSINDMLQDAGVLRITQLAERFDLPYEYLKKKIEARIGSSIAGTMQGDDLYTGYYVSACAARVRGVLRALTRPTQVAALIKAQAPAKTQVSNPAHVCLGASHAVSRPHPPLPALAVHPSPRRRPAKSRWTRSSLRKRRSGALTRGRFRSKSGCVRSVPRRVPQRACRDPPSLTG